jgi:hypothetical protein
MTDKLTTLRASLAAAGVTASSPALDSEAEQIAREERWA